MRNTKRNVAALCSLRSILLVVAMLTPCFITPLPSVAAPGTNAFTGSVSVMDWVSFTDTGSMNVTHGSPTATLLNNGQVLVAGGNAGASAELYDPATGTWSTTGNMNVGRYQHTATLLNNGKVLVAGGIGVGGSYLASAELYDPATGIWSTTGSMNVARYGQTATLLNDGNVLVAGGMGSSWLDSAELYDPVTGTWNTTGNMNVKHLWHTATLLNNGSLLVAGGIGGGVGAELYDPATGTWSTTGNMNVSRYAHTATLLNNGKVLVAGGVTPGGGGVQTSAELYDPATGIWSTTASMHYARYQHTATLLPVGKVLVAGGYGAEYSGLESAELYDPATGVWSITGSMSVARLAHTATLLPIGKVLMAGGYNGASAELATFMPGNTFTSTLTLPSRWITSTIGTQFVGTSSAVAINAGALSNDNTIWGSWIAATSGVTTTTTWDVSSEGANMSVYLRLSDVNGLIATVVSGTVNVDLTKPASTMTTLPATSSANISLSWSGSDALSGVATYDVQVRSGIGGAWTTVLSNTTSTSTNYTGASGITYYFRVRAHDMAGNVEDWPVDYDTLTTVLWKVFLPLIVK